MGIKWPSFVLSYHLLVIGTNSLVVDAYFFPFYGVSETGILSICFLQDGHFISFSILAVFKMVLRWPFFSVRTKDSAFLFCIFLTLILPSPYKQRPFLRFFPKTINHNLKLKRDCSMRFLNSGFCMNQ